MKWIKRVPALLWIALLIWAARRIEWVPFRQALSQVPWTAAMGVLLACWLATGFQALRFYFLYPGGLSAMRHVGLNFALQAGNILLPMRSGELLRPFDMKRWNRTLSLKELTGWSIADKLAEGLAMLPLVLAACGVFAGDPRFGFLSRWAWPAAAAIVCIGPPLIWLKGRREFAKQVPLSILCSFVG